MISLHSQYNPFTFWIWFLYILNMVLYILNMDPLHSQYVHPFHSLSRKKWKKSRILISCAPCTMVYNLLAARKIAVDKAVFWSTVWDELESRILLSKISTPFLAFLITFVIIKAEFWQRNTSAFFNLA